MEIPTIRARYTLNKIKFIDSRIIIASVLIAITCIGYVFYTRTNESQDTIITAVDIEGNTYRTIKIGNQTWMTENLRVTKLNDGQKIQYAPEKSGWAFLYSPGYCWPDNDTLNKGEYGALYNWYAVSTGKLAPVGWHVATDEEWNILVENLGGPDLTGGNLKKMNFTISFAGTRHYDGVFSSFDEMEKYWTATEGGWHPGEVWCYTVARFVSGAGRGSHMKIDGLSVRCVKNP